MREWTEKHIIELIKQHSGGGIVTPPIYNINLLCFRYVTYYVDVKRTYDIKAITDIAAKILHLDTSMWKSSHKLKSTLDEKWHDGLTMIIEGGYTPFYNSGKFEELTQCFLTPSEYKSTNEYNTYSQWGFKVKQMFISLPDYIPFFNSQVFSTRGNTSKSYGLSISSIISSVNGVIHDMGIEGDLLTAVNEDVRAGWTVTEGSLTESGNYYTSTAEASGADVYVVKSVFQKWFEKFLTYEIYIEVLNGDVIIRPDEIPQEGRVFYGNDIKTAYEYPDGW